jgi:anti-sigma-K factor RskA
MSADHDCGGDAAAYVLGALEPAEAEAFSRHLEQCTVCRDEVDALEGVVQALPMAAPQHPAPRRLRRRVMRAILDEPKAADHRPRRLLPASSWSSPRVALGALIAAAVVAIAVIGGLDLSGGGSTRVIRATVAGVTGSAELRVTNGHGELIVSHFSRPPVGHVYEVWLQSPGSRPVPANVLFTVTSTGSAEVGLPGSLAGISQVMVTPEPDGGSRAPTYSPVIIARLT